MPGKDDTVGHRHAEGTQIEYHLGELTAAVSAQAADIRDLGDGMRRVEAKLTGNGGPGLCTRIDRLEQQTERDQRARAAMVKVVIGIGLIAVTVAANAIWEAVK